MRAPTRSFLWDGRRARPSATGAANEHAQTVDDAPTDERELQDRSDLSYFWPRRIDRPCEHRPQGRVLDQIKRAGHQLPPSKKRPD